MIDAVTRNRTLAGYRTCLLSGTLMVLVSACGGADTGPEDEIRDWVRHGVAAAEGKDRRDLMGMISPAYVDTRGNGPDDIENILRAYFFRMNTIELVTSIEKISVIGESAAELILTVAGAGTNDGVLGFSADAYRFEFELEKNGGEWQLISARWGELGEELH